MRKTIIDAMGIPPEALTSKIPLGRFGQPEDLAEFVALVASPTGGSATKMQPVPRSMSGLTSLLVGLIRRSHQQALKKHWTVHAPKPTLV